MGHLHGPRRGCGLQGQDDRGAPRPTPELPAAFTPFRALVRGWRRGSGHVVEVQHGDYFGEDDIVRLEDDYGRSPRGLTAEVPREVSSGRVSSRERVIRMS